MKWESEKYTQRINCLENTVLEAWFENVLSLFNVIQNNHKYWLTLNQKSG
jgi:hypothetical protein